MIHIKASASPDFKQLASLQLALVSLETVQKFKAILDRALNCADPQEFATWIALSDKVNSFLEEHKTPSGN